MKILSLDASTMTAGVAVIENNEILGEITIHSKVTHSQKLMVIVDQLLKNLNTTIDTFDAIAVSIGPGSFTGVRIGMATAMGLSRAHNIGLIGVSSLEGLIHNATSFDGYIVPVQDARRNQVYTALFKNHERVTEDLAISVDELIQKLNELNQAVLLIGPDACKFVEEIDSAVNMPVVLAAPQHLNPRASSIAFIAQHQSITGGIKPNYVRKSQAETTYEEKHGKSLL
jgi:tRNA threonylcarbamoyladenosine biosynthesis protein TsaB